MPNDITPAPAIERKAIHFEVKSVSADGYGTFEGVGAAFNNLDSGGDIIAPGAFKAGLAKFLSDGFVGGVDHDWTGAIGHPASAEETSEGLFIRAALDNTPDAQAVRAKMTPNPLTGRATIRKLSIGYRAEGVKRLNGPEEVKSYWQSVGYQPSPRDLDRAVKGARLLTDLSLFEVSPVIVPMNDMASIHSVKSSVPEGFDDHLETVGFSVEGAVDRTISRNDARHKAGRVLSESNRTKIKEFLATVLSQAARLQEMLDTTEPAEKGDTPSVALSEIEPTPVVVPAIDEAALLAQFHLTMYATNPDPF